MAAGEPRAAGFWRELRFWYALLDAPEVRAKFDAYPEWKAMLKEKWPEARPWPFEVDELTLVSDRPASGGAP